MWITSQDCPLSQSVDRAMWDVNGPHGDSVISDLAFLWELFSSHRWGLHSHLVNDIAMAWVLHPSSVQVTRDSKAAAWPLHHWINVCENSVAQLQRKYGPLLKGFKYNPVLISFHIWVCEDKLQVPHQFCSHIVLSHRSHAFHCEICAEMLWDSAQSTWRGTPHKLTCQHNSCLSWADQKICF